MARDLRTWKGLGGALVQAVPVQAVLVQAVLVRKVWRHLEEREGRGFSQPGLAKKFFSEEVGDFSHARALLGDSQATAINALQTTTNASPRKDQPCLNPSPVT